LFGTERIKNEIVTQSDSKESTSKIGTYTEHVDNPQVNALVARYITPSFSTPEAHKFRTDNINQSSPALRNLTCS
jgi:hypothetical protein